LIGGERKQKGFTIHAKRGTNNQMKPNKKIEKEKEKRK
jgi:hypothetical protein